MIENLDEIGVGDGKRKGGVDSVEDQSLNSFSTLSSGSIKAGKVNTKFHDSRITLDLVDAEGSLHGDYDGGVVHVNKEGNNGFYYHSGDDNNDVDGSDCDENNDGSGCMKDRLFASVEWLEKHVPMCVLHQLSEEIQSKESSLPRISRYKSALLFIDVAGFTRLSQLLDPEDLSRVRCSISQSVSCNSSKY